jgi:di/tricarboxylate transporter
MSVILVALIILVITIFLFARETFPIAVTAVGASLAYAIAGIIPMNSVFKAYNSNTIILLAGMMIVGSSLFHTGVTDIIGKKMLKITGESESRIMLATLVISCSLSSVCSNIGVMVALVPVVTAVCIKAGFGPSRSIMALLFGAQFGGFITLVGVGSNVAAATAMQNLGLTPFGFFSITPFGLCISIIGTLYIVLVGRKLISDTGYIPEFAQATVVEFDKKKALISAMTMLCVLVVIAAQIKAIPMHIASTAGAVVIIATKCVSMPEAIKSIDWSTLIIVGALSAISAGVESSGLGKEIANNLIYILGNNPSPFMITTVIYITAAILTQFMSNIPTILLLLPIGVSIAKTIGVSPYPIVMTITLAGASSYATPFAAPQNIMTVGWTKYNFMDFVKFGSPLIPLTYIVLIVLMPFFFPY